MVVTHKSPLTCTPMHKCTVKHMVTHKNSLICTPNTQTYGHTHMHTYMHACSNSDTCACILIHSHTWYICTNKHGYSHIPHGYKHTHTHRHACMITHTVTYLQTHVHAHTVAHAHTPVHTHMHQHTHTHTDTYTLKHKFICTHSTKQLKKYQAHIKLTCDALPEFFLMAQNDGVKNPFIAMK